MDRSAAEALAYRALQFVAGDSDRLGRFLALTGIGPTDLRDRIEDPGFLVGVLDFLLNYEPDLLAFAEAAEIAPHDPGRARAALAAASGDTGDGDQSTA